MCVAVQCNACRQCSFTTNTTHFNHPINGEQLRLMARSLVLQKCSYMLKCPCGLAYVGKTNRALKTCICKHSSAIRNGDMKRPMARHLVEIKHLNQHCTLSECNKA